MPFEEMQKKKKKKKIGETLEPSEPPSNKGSLLPYTNTGTVQEISEISCPGSNIPVQSTAIWFVHSTQVHCSSKGGETDGHTQGYKDPPVPR